MIVQIAPALASEIETITRLEIDSKIASIPQCISEVDIDYSVRLQRWHTYFNGSSPQTSKPERLVLKAEVDEKMVGYIAGHLTNRFEKDAEIQSFYVLKPYQRQGIGRQLFFKFVEWMQQQHAQSLCVGIAEDNPYQAFYLKQGADYLNPHWLYWDDISIL